MPSKIILYSFLLFLLYVSVKSKNGSMERQFPEFGRPMRSEFLMNEQFILFDHGAYGTYPKTVRSALHEFQDRAEANPDLWMRREAKQELAKVRAQIAQLLNADPEDIVMVINTTGGINAIFRSLPFNSGERILHFNTAYGSMQSIVQFVVDQSAGEVSSLIFNVTYPISNDQLVEDFSAFLEENDNEEQPIKIALIDHITSVPGVIVPIERLIPLLRQRGILVLIDGAHAIGQIPIDIQAVDPDFYITNCHKWLYSVRGSAVMYVKKSHQGIIHPAHINSGYHRPAAYQDEFFWTGTMDFSPYMTVPAAIEFRTALGGEEAIRNYTHQLAIQGGNYLASLYGTEVLQEEDQMGSLVDVRFPIDNPNDNILTTDWWIDTQLYRYNNVYVSVYKHNNQWWGRHSVQIYNDMSDFEETGETFLRIFDEINSRNNSLIH